VTFFATPDFSAATQQRSHSERPNRAGVKALARPLTHRDRHDRPLRGQLGSNTCPGSCPTIHGGSARQLRQQDDVRPSRSTLNAAPSFRPEVGRRRGHSVVEPARGGGIAGRVSLNGSMLASGPAKQQGARRRSATRTAWTARWLQAVSRPGCGASS
jgi:hypothetical protein